MKRISATMSKQQAETEKLDTAVADNLPVRRRACPEKCRRDSL
jgi:hypothetical protein